MKKLFLCLFLLSSLSFAAAPGPAAISPPVAWDFNCASGILNLFTRTCISTGSGTGTVTSISVVGANGLAGTVANPTTTPALTLSTSITGVLFGNGTAIGTTPSQSANTAYIAPNGSSGAPTFRALVGADTAGLTALTKTSAYTITAADFKNNTIISANTSGGAFSLTLPNPSTVTVGKIIYIFDSTGSFGTNQLTLVRNGSENIQGVAANKVLYANFGSYAFTTLDGANWSVIGTASNTATLTFTSSGSWVVPPGVMRVAILARSGAGGGGGGTGGSGGSTTSGGGGGAGGGAGGAAPSTTATVPLTPGSTATITIGAGGTAGAAGTGGAAAAGGTVGVIGGNGNSGGNTVFAIGAATYTWYGARGGTAAVAGATYNGASPSGGAFGSSTTGGGTYSISGGSVSGQAAGAGGAAATAGGGLPNFGSGKGSPWTIGSNTGSAGGGASGGTNGGGGGGAGGAPNGLDFDAPTQTAGFAGGAGGAAGSVGSAAPTPSGAASGGEGGLGGGGGGGGGLLAVTGTAGGAGAAGTAGSNGRLILTWQE